MNPAQDDAAFKPLHGRAYGVLMTLHAFYVFAFAIGVALLSGGLPVAALLALVGLWSLREALREGKRRTRIVFTHDEIRVFRGLLGREAWRERLARFNHLTLTQDDSDPNHPGPRLVLEHPDPELSVVLARGRTLEALHLRAVNLAARHELRLVMDAAPEAAN